MPSAQPAVDCRSPDDHLRAGIQAYDAKMLDQALAGLSRHIDRHPDCVEAHFNIAAVFEELGDFGKSASHFLEAAKLCPPHLPSWQRGLMALAKARQAEAFANALVTFIGACEAHGLFWKWPCYMLQHACDHHLAQGDQATAFAFFNATIGRSQQYSRLYMCWFVFLFGGYFTRVGDMENAKNCTRFAAKELPFLVHACFDNELNARVGAVSDSFVKRFDTSVAFDDPQPAESPGGGCVVLSACDAVYFKRFAPMMALSVDLFSHGSRIVHFHVVDADAACDALVADLRAMMRRTRIGYSRQPDFQDLSPDDRLTYFTCSRFMVADQVMDRYRLPLLIADVDGVFAEDPILFADQLSEDTPLALLYGPDRLDAVYNAVGGGLVGLFPTGRTSALVELVKRHMLYWYERRQMVWFFDQMCWVSALEETKRRQWHLPVTRLHMDQGRITLGPAKFFQVFEEKKESGFDRKLGMFLSEISALWTSGAISEQEARTRYKTFFGIDTM